MKDLYLLGEVGEDFSAKDLVENLKGAGDVCVHINSIGGDVFDGLAEHNILKAHKGRVEVSIDGLAASAASLIACAGDKVTMAENALFMAHNPSAGLVGYFEAAELDKVQSMLGALRDSIITTYETRTGKPRAEIEAMVDSETWLSAHEAKAHGFIDEITGAVEARISNHGRTIFINKLELDCRKLDFEKISAAVGAVAQEETDMTEEKKGAPLDVEKIVAEAAMKERARIRNLNALKCDNAAVNAVVDLAVEDGKELSEIQPYVDAIKAAAKNETVFAFQKPAGPVPPDTDKIAEKICAVIRDQMKSGAEGVVGAAQDSAPKVDAEAQSALLAKFINQKLKGGAAR